MRHNLILDEARGVFRSAGLAFPKLPAEMASRLQKFGDWCYSTREIIASPYNLDAYLRETNAPSDYVVLAHAGHGINSYAIHYFLVIGRLRVFLQLAWGGGYEDNDARAQVVETCFALVDTFVETYDRLRERCPALTVAASDFYGSFLTVGSGAKPGRLDTSIRPHDALVAAQRAVSREVAGRT